MKLILFLICFFSANVALSEIIPKFPPVAKDVKSFLTYTDGMIILPHFPLKSIGVTPSIENRLFKVSTTSLAKYGLEIGSLIRSIDIESGKANPNFILKDFVYGIQAPLGAADSEIEINQLRVILSYDQKTINELKKKDSFSLVATGVAYIGIERKLYATKMKKVPAQKVPKVDFKIKYRPLNPPGEIIRSVKIFDNELYVFFNPIQEGSNYETYLKTPMDFFSLGSNYEIMTDNESFFNVTDWGKDQRMLILGPVSPESSCTSLIFISKTSVESVPLPCNRR